VQFTLTIVHVAGSLTSPAAAVGTTLEFGVLTIGVAPTDIGTDRRVAGSQSLGRTRARTDDVDLVEKLTTFTARRQLRHLLSTVSHQRSADASTPNY